MSDEHDGPWGVWEEQCQHCGKKLVTVARVESMERGEVEFYQDGISLCSACRSALEARLAMVRRDGPPPVGPEHL